MDVKALSAVTKTSWAIPVQYCSFRHIKLPSPHIRMKKKKSMMRRLAVKAASSEESRRRSIVDEEMLVLRKRIYELRMEEINGIPPPEEWMEWEKKWYPTYGSDVCSSLLCLQNMLLNTRPALALAVLAIISFSLPLSVLLLLIQTQFHLKGVTMELLGNFHG